MSLGCLWAMVVLGPWVTTVNRAFLLNIIGRGGRGRKEPLLCYVTAVLELFVIAAEPSLSCLIQTFSFLQNFTPGLLFSSAYACLWLRPPSRCIQALMRDKTVSFKGKQRHLRGTEGMYCYSKPITHTGPWIRSKFSLRHQGSPVEFSSNSLATFLYPYRKVFCQMVKMFMLLFGFHANCRFFVFLRWVSFMRLCFAVS